MPKSTTPITYLYRVEGREVEISRRHVGTAYPRNGNVGNPTEYFRWAAKVDGETIGASFETRAAAYEYARARILGIDYYWDPSRPNRARNVRFFTVVRDEMRANYVGRVDS